jgi:hypothetical protein
MDENDNYFVIQSSEDGISIEQMNGETLLRRIDSNYWGEASRNFFRSVPGQDKGCFMGPDGILIVRGSVVVPHPREVVTRFELP